MKKAIAVSLLILLALSALPCMAEAQTMGYKGAFTLEYPEGWAFTEGDWEFEEEFHEDVGSITGPEATDLCLNVEVWYLEDWAGMGLGFFGEEDKSWYLEQFPARLTEAKDMRCEWISSAAQGIPLAFVSYTFDGVMSFRAEAIINGWFIMIDGDAASDATYMNARDLTEEDEAIFRQIVSSFVMTAESDERFDQLMRAQ